MKNRLHTLKFIVTFVLLFCISLSSQAADKKKKKVNTQITPAPVEKQLVMNGTFFVEPTSDRYGYSYYLIPDQNSSSVSEFPYLSYSGPKLFLNFVNDKISFELRDLQRYKGIKGFDEYYEGIKDLDIYSLKAKEKEIRAALNDAQAAYFNEYQKYLDTLFLIDQDDLIPVSESTYNIDSEIMSNIPLPFAHRIINQYRPLANFSDPYKAIMTKFGEHSTFPKFYQHAPELDFKIPVSIAKKYFDSFPGQVGSRIGEAQIRYWVSPNRGGISGVRLWITMMDLKRVELTFLGNERFSEVWLPGNQFTLTLAKDISLSTSTMTDNHTKLMWQLGEGGEMRWDDAIAYCKNLSFAEYNDWRLPNIEELKSIIDIGADKTYFPNASQYYWSSTAYAGSTVHAWGVNFYDYGATGYFKTNSTNVRCVRGGQ